MEITAFSLTLAIGKKLNIINADHQYAYNVGALIVGEC